MIQSAGMVMDRTVRTAVVALTLAVGFAGAVTAGPVEDGVTAYKRGDYATALRLWRPAADQGDARAQYNLGTMYYAGRGVGQNYATSASWYRKAADQGDAKAQCNLGTLYATGRGVPLNPAAAVNWFRKAADQGNADAQDFLAACRTGG
jgi:uncharacterized protein